MDEYIKRSDAVQCARDVANDFKNDGFVEEAGGADAVGDWLQDFPAADVRPVVRGRWKLFCGRLDWQCSNCNWSTRADIPRNFCPNCGADMRGGKLMDELVKAIRQNACHFDACGMCPKRNALCLDRRALQAADAIDELSKLNCELLFRVGQAEALIDYYQTGRMTSEEGNDDAE